MTRFDCGDERRDLRKFKRKGEQSPVAIYSLTPGADALTMRETRDGLLRKTVVWYLEHRDTWCKTVTADARARRGTGDK